MKEQKKSQRKFRKKKNRKSQRSLDRPQTSAQNIGKKKKDEK